MTLRQIPHIRVVKPAGTQGLLVGGRNTRFYIALPGQEECEIPAMRAARLDTSFETADEVELRMLATLEIVYEV